MIPQSSLCKMPSFISVTTLTTGVDMRTDTGDRQEMGLAGQTQVFVRGSDQPAFVMGLLRLVWNCHEIAQLGGTSG